MQMPKFTKQLLAIQLFGALMFAVVSLAYFLGLPSDSVYHGELAFRIVIGALGSVFFVSSIIMLAVRYVTK